MSLPPVKVLFLELSNLGLEKAREALISSGLRCVVSCLNDKSCVEARLGEPVRFDILITDTLDQDLLKVIRRTQPFCKISLVTNVCFPDLYDRYLWFMEDPVDQIVGCFSAQQLSCELQAAVCKLGASSPFGLHHYLEKDTPLKSFKVYDSQTRFRHHEEMQRFATHHHQLSKRIGRLLFSISEELLTNALYDAPMLSGKKEFLELKREDNIIHEEAYAATLSYGFDGRRFVVGVTDNFGCLQKSSFFKPLLKFRDHTQGIDIIEKKNRGAGIGLFRVIQSSHGIIGNVQSGKKTEVISILDTTRSVKGVHLMSRSINYTAISS